QLIDDLQIGPLVAATDVVFFARLTVCERQQNARAVIFDKKPVAHITAVSVNRQWLSVKRIEQHQRNQLFRKLIWTVVVRAIGNDRRQTICLLPGTDQMVSRSFRCGVWRIRGIGRRFGKQSRFTQAAVYLVGRNVQESKSALCFSTQCRDMFARGFEQRECARNVRLDERRRVVNRAIYMTFSGEIHHACRCALMKDRTDRVSVGDVGFYEMHPRVFEHILKICQIPGVCELINNDEAIVGIGERLPDKVGADESCAARNNHRFHQVTSKRGTDFSLFHDGTDFSLFHIYIVSDRRKARWMTSPKSWPPTPESTPLSLPTFLRDGLCHLPAATRQRTPVFQSEKIWVMTRVLPKG